MFSASMVFDAFRDRLSGPDALSRLRAGLIGAGRVIDAGYGPKPLLYADYTASGRALQQIEQFVQEEVLPWYANTHTEASYCGMVSSQLREEARRIIGRITGAGADCHVIFAGNGATAGLNRIVQGLDIAEKIRAGKEVVVFTGPYEHHSNILPWRESGAEIRVIPEGAEGGPDLKLLEAGLKDCAPGTLVIGTFTAASNVTGILCDTDAVTRLLKTNGALAIWDYAAAAPYIPVSMGEGPAAKDAIVYSSHKFVGGPGASGVLLLRKGLSWRQAPAQPGGGTVRFVSPWDAVYSDNLIAREEAGTPDVIGDIRAALVLLVKEAIGAEVIAQQEHALRRQALDAWRDHPRIELLGLSEAAEALPVFSFRIRDAGAGYVHHQLFTRMLSDHAGIQVRGGCACAGPYAHQLLGIDQPASQELWARLQAGEEMAKPGWVRLNLSYIHAADQVATILESVADLAMRAPDLARDYTADAAKARFRPAA